MEFVSTFEKFTCSRTAKNRYPHQCPQYADFHHIQDTKWNFSSSASKGYMSSKFLLHWASFRTHDGKISAFRRK